MLSVTKHTFLCVSVEKSEIWGHMVTKTCPEELTSNDVFFCI